MNTCIYCTQSFQTASAEHLLQNFLGARKTSTTIVCNECQALFGQTIDSAFEKGLQPIRNIFGTEGGRGGAGPTLKKLSTTGSSTVDFAPGAQPRLSEPIVETSLRADGETHDVHIKLGHINQLGWAIKKLRDKLPNYPISESFLRSIATPQQAQLNEYVQLNLKLGGAEYFRGLLKAVFNLFASEHPSEAMLSAFDPLRNFVRNGIGTISDFVRWIATDTELRLPKLGPIDHAIVIRTKGASVEGVVQLFGDLIHPIRLSKTYGGSESGCSYFVDPLRESDPSFLLNPSFDDSSLIEFEGQSEQNNTIVQGALRSRLERVLERYSEREVQRVRKENIAD